MKKTYLFCCVAIVVLLSCSSQQYSSGTAAVIEMLTAKTYTFVAQNVIPTEDARYNPRTMFPNASATLYQLSGGYDLRITPDSVIAYLPFFGRAYTAPVNPSEGGIKFTSTRFQYKQTLRKKMYEIEITPHDVQDVSRLFLTISASGFTTLRIQSINRTPISFNGIVEAKR